MSAEKAPGGATPVEAKVAEMTLLTSVADLSTTAILAACGIKGGATAEGVFNGYMTVTSTLGTFHVHIHACATRAETPAAPDGKMH